ncbi:MAG: helicase-related protein [Myxococcota bacterium]
MTAASVHEALAVLGRTAGWLARDGNVARARYVEATLGRWAALPSESPEGDITIGFQAIRDEISGFDAEPEEARATRASRLVGHIAALRARFGAIEVPTPFPRAVLLPAGILADLPPKPPPAPVYVLPVGPTDELEARAPEARGERAPEERPERGERTDRPERAERAERTDRPERAERAERTDRPERPERRERGDRRDPSRRRQDDREPGEGRRGERRGEERAAEPVVVEAPVVVPEPPKPPPPPPEPRVFPLGHPEGTGEPVEALGVLDEAELALFAAADITSVADLLLRPPVATDRAGERWNPGVPPEGPVIVRGTVKARLTRFTPGVRRHEVILAHDKGEVSCRWLGPVPAEVAVLRAGAEVGFAGLLETDVEGGEPVEGAEGVAAPAPVRAVLYEGEPLGIEGRGGDWFPRYEIPGIDEPRARAVMRAALRKHADSLQDHLPADVIERYRLLSLPLALRDVHFPSNASRKGRSRLGFDELLQVQLGVALLRARERRDRGISNPVSHALVAQALGMGGWQFTDEQEQAFDDIRRDLRRPQPMTRLLQGDVGVGKHAVVQAAMVLVAEAKHQALFLAPDALSAEHRYLFAESFFKSVGFDPMLLTGPPTRAQADQLKKGDALVIYATHALAKDVPTFRKLGLVVYEEQGTYGAADISPFETQGQRPDLLVFTPTPVPSALLLNLYGQLAMTVINSGTSRGVDTTAHDTHHRDEAYNHGREAIEAGHQVMIVFPVIRGQDLLSPSEARRLSEVLASETFPGARVGIFNGGMSREERFRAYDDFQHRRTEVLLCTTHVEHGPVVPNASVMIVEQAQQFDLVRLHRLRSHISNGWRRGQCMLIVGDDPRPEARHNIDLLLKETDGYRIAELDLRHRGIEAALGDRAADAPDFVWADPVVERDLMVRTRQEAVRLLNADPGLKRRTNRPLLNLVRARFGEDAVPEGGSAPPPPSSVDANARRRRRRRGR